MKVFGIGLSKTGTSSLSKALEILGYKSKHHPHGMLRYNSGKLSIKLDEIKNYDAFTDTPIARFYKQLDVSYPNSKFILTIREMNSWLNSCKRHFHSSIEEVGNKILGWTGKWDISKDPIAKLHLDLYNTTAFDRKKFKSAYRRHLDDVLNYFKDRKKDLCIINICGGEGWERLCPFLGKPTLKIHFPNENIREKYHRKKIKRIRKFLNCMLQPH